MIRAAKETMNIITALQQQLGTAKVLTGEDLNDRYNHIWTMDQSLWAKAYLLPSSTEEVAKICEICYQYEQPMVVFGGVTNLVGATETYGEEIVISMERMNKVEVVDTQNRTLTVQSGAILEHIQIMAKENDLFFPLNFGAKGSCQIGGCISTNAGGIRVLKYGMTRQQVLGLEVVLPNGQILSSLKQMVKDNSGYDLKQLFIGAEGTLGIVTKAVLKLQEIPTSRNSAFVAFDDFDRVIDFLKFAEQGLAGQLSAFEFLDKSSYETLTATETTWRPPLPHGYNYYVLLESLGANQDKDQARLEQLLEDAMLQELFVDGVFAHTETDLQWFWNIREDVSILAKKCAFDQHFDVSLPLRHMKDYIKKVNTELTALAEVQHCFTFGHLADGNIHFVVGKSSATLPLKERINEIVYFPLTDLAGSVSAEHGIGLHKKKYLPICRQPTEIYMMQTLKKVFDPKKLLNKGRIVD